MVAGPCSPAFGFPLYCLWSLRYHSLPAVLCQGPYWGTVYLGWPTSLSPARDVHRKTVVGLWSLQFSWGSPGLPEEEPRHSTSFWKAWAVGPLTLVCHWRALCYRVGAVCAWSSGPQGMLAFTIPATRALGRGTKDCLPVQCKPG